MDKEIGSLETGKKADLVVIGLDEPNAVPMYDAYAQLAYALKASDVDTVIIGGRVVMRNRKLLTVDEAAAIAKAREYKKQVAASLGIQKIDSLRIVLQALWRVAPASRRLHGGHLARCLARQTCRQDAGATPTTTFIRRRLFSRAQLP